MPAQNVGRYRGSVSNADPATRAHRVQPNLPEQRRFQLLVPAYVCVLA